MIHCRVQRTWATGTEQPTLVRLDIFCMELWATHPTQGTYATNYIFFTNWKFFPVLTVYVNVTDGAEMDPETGRGGDGGKKHKICTAAFGGYLFRISKKYWTKVLSVGNFTICHQQWFLKWSLESNMRKFWTCFLCTLQGLRMFGT